MSVPAYDPGASPARLSQSASPLNQVRHACVHGLLEATAQRHADCVAVELDGRSLTYAELHARANQLARVLRKHGVQREVLVGVCMERSLEMEVALLGILKAGGAYVPLDASFGLGRIKYVLDEARVKVLITQKSLRSLMPPTEAQVICLEPSWDLIADESDQPVPSGVGPSNLAYVIYTSGSTGKPKGVQLEHRSLANLLCSMREEPGINESDVLLSITTISFDLSVPDIFLPLMAGARLVIASREATFDGKLLRSLLKSSGATFMQATPTTWQLLLEAGWTGDRKLKAIVGGEAVSPELARKLAASCGSVWNMYGPTETTVWSSGYRIEGRDERSVPIGTPIANTSMYVLGPNREPLPYGAEGELYVGGDGLARGYFEQPELTAEKFVHDPFSSRPGARMYRTGDLARYRPDGNLEFLGRIDHQVKIRGFRIELGEIEAVLSQHPAVKEVIVVAREDTPGNKRLVAYLIPDQRSTKASASQADKSALLTLLTPQEADLSIEELRAFLKDKLPYYMVPAAFLFLDAMPLMPNGKVNRKVLPTPDMSRPELEEAFIAPHTPTQIILAHIWMEVLRLDTIGIRDNFFDLGGASIQSLEIIAKAKDAGFNLALEMLF